MVLFSSISKKVKERVMKNVFKLIGLIAIVAVIGLSMAACDDDPPPGYNNPNPGGSNPGGSNPGGTNPGGTNPGSYNLGGTGPGGGIIFYYSEAGFYMSDNMQFCHYLEVASQVYQPMAWASPDYATTRINGLSENIGTGRNNTKLILATDPNAPAAKACVDYRGGGLSDWFLPSDKEMGELHKNKALVPNMGTNRYWLSTQGYFGMERERGGSIGFVSGQILFGNPKGEASECFTRAIRAF
jgi:hypothetical protein